MKKWLKTMAWAAAAAHAIVFSHFFITAPSYPDPATGN